MTNTAPALNHGHSHGAEEAAARAFVRREAYYLFLPDRDEDGNGLVAVTDGNLVSPSGLKIPDDEFAHASYLVRLRPPHDDALLPQSGEDGLKRSELQQIDQHVRHM